MTAHTVTLTHTHTHSQLQRWQPHIRRWIEGNGADADTIDDTKPMVDAKEDTRTTTHADAIDVD